MTQGNSGVQEINTVPGSDQEAEYLRDIGRREEKRGRILVCEFSSFGKDSC